MTKYLILEEVLLIHDTMIEKYGGSGGIRDLGMIESALARPQAGFGDFEAYPTLYLKAAVLCHSILKNHGFVDGNKRTASVAMITFLLENNITVTAKDGALHRLALTIENNTLPENQIAAWLKDHTKSI